MTISYRTIFVFVLLINRVSLQVVDVVGGSVVLPCSSRNIMHKLDKISVRWRHNGSKNVYDIIEGKCSVERQDPVYKNRTKTFPGEYEKGNFTLKLNNLRRTDAGEYQCYITHSNELVKVQLLIKESTTQGGQVTGQEGQAAEKENQAAGKKDQAAVTRRNWIRISIPVCCVCMLLCVVLSIVVIILKRGKTSSRRVSAKDSSHCHQTHQN